MKYFFEMALLVQKFWQYKVGNIPSWLQGRSWLILKNWTALVQPHSASLAMLHCHRHINKPCHEPASVSSKCQGWTEGWRLMHFFLHALGWRQRKVHAMSSLCGWLVAAILQLPFAIKISDRQIVQSQNYSGVSWIAMSSLMLPSQGISGSQSL